MTTPTHLTQILSLKSSFRSVHGFPATHVFVGPCLTQDIPEASRPYGLIPVFVEDPRIEIAVGVLYPPHQHGTTKSQP